MYSAFAGRKLPLLGSYQWGAAVIGAGSTQRGQEGPGFWSVPRVPCGWGGLHTDLQEISKVAFHPCRPSSPSQLGRQLVSVGTGCQLGAVLSARVSQLPQWFWPHPGCDSTQEAQEVLCMRSNPMGKKHNCIAFTVHKTLYIWVSCDPVVIRGSKLGR